MFTGIVEELGTVLAAEPVTSEWGAGLRLTIAASVVLDGSGTGASIAVNGCCLTLVDQGTAADGSRWWGTDVSDETLARTTTGHLRVGDRVNLERPMALGDRLGGHIVLGHVDCVGEIVRAAPDLVVRVPAAIMRYLVEKGSVTVDGISLTAFDLDAADPTPADPTPADPVPADPTPADPGQAGASTGTFAVAVIPHTAAVTTLGLKGPGDAVNIEADVLAKHIERLAEPYRT